MKKVLLLLNILVCFNIAISGIIPATKTIIPQQLASNDAHENYGVQVLQLPNCIMAVWVRVTNEGNADGSIYARKGLRSGDTIAWNAPYELQSTINIAGVGLHCTQNQTFYIDSLGVLQFYFGAFQFTAYKSILYKRTILASSITSTSVDTWSDTVRLEKPVERKGLFYSDGQIIKCTTGTYAGRLYWPMEQLDSAGAYIQQTISTSDNNGGTWTQRAILPATSAQFNEATCGLKSDGSIYVLLRDNAQPGRLQLYYTTSTDGGQTFATPLQSNITSPEHHGKLLHLSNGSYMLLWNNRISSSGAFRTPLTIAITNDDFQTWTNITDIATTSNMFNQQLHNGGICQLNTGEILVGISHGEDYMSGSSAHTILFPLTAIYQNNVDKPGVDTVWGEDKKAFQKFICKYTFAEMDPSFEYILPVSMLDSQIINRTRTDAQDIRVYSENGKLLNREIISYSKSNRSGYIGFVDTARIGTNAVFYVETGCGKNLGDNKEIYTNRNISCAFNLHESISDSAHPALAQNRGVFTPLYDYVPNYAWVTNPVSRPDGKMGKALQFNVNGEIVVGRISALENARQFGFSMIFSHVNSNVFGSYWGIFGSWASYMMLSQNVNGYLYFYIGDTYQCIPNTPNGETHRLDINVDLDATPAGADNANKVQMLIDGVEGSYYSPGSFPAATPANGNPLVLGAHSSGLGQGCNATIEEYKFYSTSRSKETMQAEAAFSMRSDSQWINSNVTLCETNSVYLQLANPSIDTIRVDKAIFDRATPITKPIRCNVARFTTTDSMTVSVVIYVKDSLWYASNCKVGSVAGAKILPYPYPSSILYVTTNGKNYTVPIKPLGTVMPYKSWIMY